MICDHLGCKHEPTRGPRLVVPSRTWWEPEHRALKMMTTLHYCELHRGDVVVADLLSAKVRADFEAIAKRKRPIDFRCDFDAAFIEPLLVTTPEYRAWMARIDIAKLVRAA